MLILIASLKHLHIVAQKLKMPLDCSILQQEFLVYFGLMHASNGSRRALVYTPTFKASEWLSMASVRHLGKLNRALRSIITTWRIPLPPTPP